MAFTKEVLLPVYAYTEHAPGKCYVEYNDQTIEVNTEDLIDIEQKE